MGFSSIFGALAVSLRERNCFKSAMVSPSLGDQGAVFLLLEVPSLNPQHRHRPQYLGGVFSFGYFFRWDVDLGELVF